MSIHAPISSVELQRLQLDDARALLVHGLNINLPAAEVSATEHLQAIIDGLCELSLKDPLTGLANRRHFRAVLDRAIDVVARSGEPALMLMLDIDHFKNVNDTYGHNAGDQVLQAIAKALMGCVRPMDTVARLGGEEFAIMLPSCHAAYGSIVAERIRKTIESMDIPIASGQSIQVTISIGGAFAPEWVRSTADLWSERVDIQLYRAKTEGRNRVCLDHQQEVFVSAEEKNLLFGHLSLGEPAWIESAPSSDTSGGSGNATMQRVF